MVEILARVAIGTAEEGAPYTTSGAMVVGRQFEADLLIAGNRQDRLQKVVATIRANQRTTVHSHIPCISQESERTMGVLKLLALLYGCPEAGSSMGVLKLLPEVALAMGVLKLALMGVLKLLWKLMGVLKLAEVAPG